MPHTSSPPTSPEPPDQQRRPASRSPGCRSAGRTARLNNGITDRDIKTLTSRRYARQLAQIRPVRRPPRCRHSARPEGIAQQGLPAYFLAGWEVVVVAWTKDTET